MGVGCGEVRRLDGAITAVQAHMHTPSSGPWASAPAPVLVLGSVAASASTVEVGAGLTLLGLCVRLVAPLP
jgi:hypothetical protein